MKKMELKFNVVEDNEFRETIKELIKTQVTAISREEFRQVTQEALSDKVKKICKRLDFKEEIKQVIKECIYNSIPSPYRDFNAQVKESIKECVKEILGEKMKKMEW